MIRGFYRFTQDGVVTESDNVITSDGKDMIAKYLAGLVGSYAGAIVLGVGTTTAANTDKRMDYEISRVPITSRNVSSQGGSLYQVSFKGQLPPVVAGVIRESGILSQVFNNYSGVFGDRLLSRFVSSEGWAAPVPGMSMTVDQQTYSSLSSATNNSVRIGNEAVRFLSTANTPVNITISSNTVQGSLSGYSSSDTIALAYSSKRIPAAAQVTLRFHTDSTNYWSSTASLIQNTANDWVYQILRLQKSTFINSGQADWAEINYCSIVVSAPTTTVSTNFEMILDGLSVFDTDYINPDYSLISRSVVPSPGVVKETGKTMDIEYVLEFSL